MDFGKQVKYVRLQLHLSQTDFGNLLGVNFTTINRWENGKTDPSFKALRAFERVCKENNIELPKEIS